MEQKVIQVGKSCGQEIEQKSGYSCPQEYKNFADRKSLNSQVEKKSYNAQVHMIFFSTPITMHKLLCKGNVFGLFLIQIKDSG